MKHTLQVASLIGALCLGGMLLSSGVGWLFPSPVTISTAEIAWSAD